MGAQSRQIAVLKKSLDNGFVELEALLFPGVSELGDGIFPAERVLVRKVKARLSDLALPELHQRAVPPEIGIREVEIPVVPAKRSPCWREPVQLTFQVLEWRQAQDAWIAYVPTLGIEVVARDQEKLRLRVPGHIQSALVRHGALKSLGALIPFGRWREISVATRPLNWRPRTPKEVAKEDAESKNQKDKVLRQNATLLHPPSQPEAFEVEAAVEQLARGLTDLEARSVLLVGAAGSGKTAVFKECVRRGATLGLAQHKVWMTTGSRLVAGMSGFGMWQERCLAICKVLRQSPAILHVGNLLEFIQVGKSEHNQQGIASFLRPYLERRDLQVVAECTPAQLSIIETTDPRLVDVFTQVRILEPDPAKGRQILFRWAEVHRLKNRRAFTLDAIETVDRLHRRFGGYSAYPGRPLRFLRNLLEAPRLEGMITKNHVFNEFSRETGMPTFLIDENVAMNLEKTRQWFMERLLGQEAAVNLVVDVLATAKARMARPRKPVASLMFIGPTGVGKTQMAKCLAEYLFGDAHRLIRLDMSEYSNESAVKRLVGDASAAEGLLTAKVREQPFSIVLFDEFEKADPLFFDLLLQVLGEGRLTDGAGRLADFTNSVVIMTSNLGAQSYAHTPLGFVQGSATTKDAAEHFTRAVQKHVRPELFNRLDAVVPFAPLDAKAILEVARRELELIKRRDGVLARHLKLSLDEATLAWIAAQGFDEKYGARPLKRAFEKHLLVPLAEGVNACDGTLLLQASADGAGDRLKVSVKPQMNAHGYPVQAHTPRNAAETLALACGSIRRQVNCLKKGAVYSEVSNLAYYLERLSKRQRQNPGYRGDAAPPRFCLADYESLLKQTSALETKICDTEDKHLLCAYGQGEEPKVTVADLKTEWQELLLRYLEMTWPHPTGQVCLGVYSRHIELTGEIVRAYVEAARARGAKIQCLALEPSPPNSSGGRPIRSNPLRHLDNLEDFTRLIGVVVEVTGRMSHPYFAPEHGKQVVINQGEKEKQLRSFLVDVSSSSLEQYQPPAGVEFPKVGDEHSVIRRFDAIQQQVHDDRLGRLSWPDLSLSRMIRKILDQLHEQALEALVSE